MFLSHITSKRPSLNSAGIVFQFSIQEGFKYGTILKIILISGKSQMCRTKEIISYQPTRIFEGVVETFDV